MILVSDFEVVESYCVPNFDSPSVFARILDKDKGGHFSIMPTVPFMSKQNYLASSNVRLFAISIHPISVSPDRGSMSNVVGADDGKRLSISITASQLPLYCRVGTGC